MLAELAARRFDLLIVGGGIHGAFAAWDAASRGLSVALVDRADFGGGASANSLKIVHGGFRYLQHANLARVRASAEERWRLARMAPHLVSPLACVVPTESRLQRSRPVMATALSIYEMLTSRRTLASAAPRQACRLLDRDEYRSLAGRFAVSGATGAALWWDGRLESPDRFLIGVVMKARSLGAVTANYVEVIRLAHGPSGVEGAVVRDGGGETATVAARMVLIAANDRAPSLTPPGDDVETGRSASMPAFALAANVVVARPAERVAAAIPNHGQSRLLFAVPWREHTMIGTTQSETGGPDTSSALRHSISRLLRDVNEALPDIGLAERDVTLVHHGRLPGTAARLLERPIVVDHAARDGVRGVVTVIGVKWTTARRTAERAVDVCMERLGRARGVAGTRDGVLGPQQSAAPGHAARDVGLAPDIEGRLAVLYGPALPELQRLVAERPELATPLPGSLTIEAQLVHGIRHEMAQRLDDLVLRRTELGSAGHPGAEALAAAARVAASELRWSEGRAADEVSRVNAAYPAA